MMRKQVHKEGSRVGSSADHWLAVGHAGSRVSCGLSSSGHSTDNASVTCKT